MNKKSNRSLNSIRSGKSQEEIYVPSLDVLTVKIKSLKFTTDDRRRHSIKVTFMDQLLLHAAIIPKGHRDTIADKTIARGTMNYDPSDYEKMCLVADNPLVVRVQPVKTADSTHSSSSQKSQRSQKSLPYSKSNMVGTSSFKMESPPTKPPPDVHCCNVDILALFKGKDKMRVKKRLQPMIEPTALQQMSWDNLPLLTMELEVERNPLNAQHHNVLKEANFMKITLVAAYNVLTPYNDEFTYTAATKGPLGDENESSILIFNYGSRFQHKFNSKCFYPKWESLRLDDDAFTKGENKLSFNLSDVQNDGNINLDHYLTSVRSQFAVVWGSFHRIQMLNEDQRLRKHLRQYQWPIEFHIFGEDGGYSFMGFMDLFRLLYPGETIVRLAVPLQWVNASLMMEKCKCDLLLMPNFKDPLKPSAPAGKTKGIDVSASAEMDMPRPTGADDNCSFLIVEVQLARPLTPPSIPPVIPEPEIKEMLSGMERTFVKVICTGRGQLPRDWQATVRSAANLLRRVPYYGMTEFCAFYRQLSETRTRVELTTSCWQDAAIYVNNNFVVQDFLQSDDMFEEMLMMAHTCLMRDACSTLVGMENSDQNPTLRAARHARHLQDIPHAVELYLQLVTEGENNPNSWRELSTCLKDIDKDLAKLCINKAVFLDPRHPLTLLSKGSMLYEEDPDGAELFFKALLTLYPFWTTGWVIAQAFYVERQEFYMADKIIELVTLTAAQNLAEDLGTPRTWEKELGDWWDHTPLLPGTSLYFDAADLLLRLREMPLAEVCLGRALALGGESAAYAHLVALSCRLRGDVDTAMCHVKGALELFGEISYLRSLEAECYHQQGDRDAALSSYEKSGNMATAYSILISLPCRDPNRTRSVLVDLLRRQPSAYAWMALADDWLMRRSADVGDHGDGLAESEVAISSCAVACARQALKWDRQYGRAWAMLAQLVRPKARRLYCRDMATASGYEWPPEEFEMVAESQHSLCYRVGTALRECHCDICEPIKF